mgnify:CR=1 FL=1
MLKWFRKLEQRALQKAAATEAKSFYFAYGSNIHRARWKEYLGWHDVDKDTSVVLGPAWLPDMKLIFHYRSSSWDAGALDIVPSIGHVVPGLLLKVEAQTSALLDKKEGAPNYYQRKEIQVLDKDGRTLNAFTYQLQPKRHDEFIAPSKEYLSLCQAGYKEHSLPQKPLDFATKNEWATGFPEHVFVYGTLLQGERLHHHIQEFAPSIQKAKIKGCLYSRQSYPFVLPSQDDDDWVQGELISTQALPGLLQKIDGLEGFEGYLPGHSLFHRIIRPTFTPEGKSGPLAWCYQSPEWETKAKRILSGDYRIWKKSGK